MGCLFRFCLSTNRKLLSERSMPERNWKKISFYRSERKPIFPPHSPLCSQQNEAKEGNNAQNEFIEAQNLNAYKYQIECIQIRVWMHRNLRLYASKKMSLPQQCHNIAFYPFLDTSTGNKFELCSSFKYLCVRFLNHKPIIRSGIGLSPYPLCAQSRELREGVMGKKHAPIKYCCLWKSCFIESKNHC